MTRRNSAEQLEKVRVLAHPLRLRLYELFAEAPRTTKQAAEALKLPPTRLYHHVAALERVGLLRLRETRRKRGTVEKHYEAAEGVIAWEATGRGPAGRQLARNSAAALALRVLERARADLAAAMETPDDSLDPIVGRLLLVGSPARLRAMHAEIMRLLDRFRRESRKDRPPTRRASLTVIFTPAAGG